MKIGILGSGQLGRMLALAGMPLGATFSFFDSTQGAPTRGIGTTTLGDFRDLDALTSFAQLNDVITYEFENIPAEAALHLSKIVPVYPPPRALEVSQERVAEKNFFAALNLPGPRFVGANSEEELRTAIESIGTPCIVKTCRLGYDGKGQMRVASARESELVWSALGKVPLIVEQLITFTRELSIIGVRSSRGEIAIYPLIENYHRDGILRRSEFPAPRASQQLNEQAETIISTVLNELQYVGTLAIELFEEQGILRVNEMAPRVHNSGHITQDAAVTSQFENHIRALMGLPLGPTLPRCRGVMLNVLGHLPDSAKLVQVPEAKLHLYNKTEAVGRKLGHVNTLDPSTEVESTLRSLIENS